MAEIYLRITPRDPVVIRDGRPFGAGASKMRALPWPYPQTMSSTVRTMLGKEQGHGFDAAGVGGLLTLGIAGGFPERRERLFFPTPADLVCAEDAPPFTLRPFGPAGPAVVSGSVLKPEQLESLPYLPTGAGEFKPVPPHPFVEGAWMVDWLLEANGPMAPGYRPGTVPARNEERTHVQVDPATFAAADEMLFSSVGLRLEPGFSFSCRIRGEEGALAPLRNLRAYHPLGGERRLAWFERCGRPAGSWECPSRIRTALGAGPLRVRLVLGTPGIFADGWVPQWLREGGLVPGTRTVRLRLVSAAVSRWLPVSGWSYDRRSFGAKPIRRLVPAGSVYFCEVEPGSDPAELAAVWLEPVCDDAQDGRDGYGLALWGIWNPHA
ncbi:MAG: type III-B CRISPR module-associated protein Cmr3 [Acidobacteriaceae bacterium]|jgi:CRISPR-associated protein Cmr3|nr:type III-B CRISPR module-associated protein Cmr3 [Acidobacteriaceae bacterium]